MSYCRVNQFSFPENINHLLNTIDQKKKFTPSDLKLLDEYRNISNGQNALVERAAAQEAFEQIKAQTNCTLSELGIKLPLDQVKHGGETKIGKREQKYIEQTFEINKRFLHLWDALRKLKQKTIEEIDDVLGILDDLKETVNRSQTQDIFVMPTAITEVLSAEGYKVTATTAKPEELTVAEIVEKGIKLEAKNAEGDKAEIVITGTEVYCHIEDAQDNLFACKSKSESLGERIEEKMEALSFHYLVDASFITNESNYGRRTEDATPSQNTNEAAQIALMQNTQNTTFKH